MDLVVAQFPGGLDFEIDSDGSQLSEGQRQIICCVRALLSEYILYGMLILLENSLKLNEIQTRIC